LPGGGDRRDAQEAEPLELVLEGQDDLREGPVGRPLDVEGLDRAEAQVGGDGAVDLVGADRVADERVVGDVAQTLVDQLAVRGGRRGRRGGVGAKTLTGCSVAWGTNCATTPAISVPWPLVVREKSSLMALLVMTSRPGATRPRKLGLPASMPVSMIATALSCPW
jgi:hypothetical protein